jgi:Outer membrane protein beta-barrel domain
MKKLIVCILCLASMHGFAQFRLGVQGSFSSLNMWQSDGYGGLPTGLHTEAMNGFQGGLVGEYDLGYSGLVLQPAVMYAENGSHLVNTQGFYDTGNETIGLTDTHLKVYSIRVPINLLFKYELNSRVKVFIGAGPYIAKNISGSEKGNIYYVEDNNNTVELSRPLNNKAKMNSNTSLATQGITNITPFDFGADLLFGASYKKFDFSISYNRGFSRIYHTSYANAGNTFWNFTVAYTILGHDRKPKL